MTQKQRQDQLNEAWCKYMNKCSVEIMQALAFALRWADAHPVVKVGGALKNYERGYEEAIDKACSWVHTALYLDHERSIEHRYATLEELLNDFRKAMKGE